MNQITGFPVDFSEIVACTIMLPVVYEQVLEVRTTRQRDVEQALRHAARHVHAEVVYGQSLRFVDGDCVSEFHRHLDIGSDADFLPAFVYDLVPSFRGKVVRLLRPVGLEDHGGVGERYHVADVAVDESDLRHVLADDHSGAFLKLELFRNDAFLFREFAYEYSGIRDRGARQRIQLFEIVRFHHVVERHEVDGLVVAVAALEFGDGGQVPDADPVEQRYEFRIVLPFDFRKLERFERRERFRLVERERAVFGPHHGNRRAFLVVLRRVHGRQLLGVSDEQRLDSPERLVLLEFAPEDGIDVVEHVGPDHRDLVEHEEVHLVPFDRLVLVRDGRLGIISEHFERRMQRGSAGVYGGDAGGRHDDYAFFFRPQFLDVFHQGVRLPRTRRSGKVGVSFFPEKLQGFGLGDVHLIFCGF